jgi:hypothetical protein
MAKKLSKNKAEKILHDKQVKGRPLTEKQRKFFGAVASGAVPKAQPGRAVSDNTRAQKYIPLLSEEASNAKLVRDVQESAATVDRKKKLKPIKDAALRTADVTTDLMQLGNFIPNLLAQIVGKIGNIAGVPIDAYQAAEAFNEGDYVETGINLASVGLPMMLGTNTFRRNSKYLRPGQPLYPLSPQGLNRNLGLNVPRVNYIEPFTRTKGMTRSNLLANRGLLGALGAETVYDVKKQGGAIPKAQNGIEGTMGGLTDKGFNYNGAWGGQFAMGGMLPGVQGHMYARTGAPSEGKYAKKTLPSAAEGYEILPDPTDPERKYKLSAVVQSAKDILNPVLRSKNPKLYDEWQKGRVEAIRSGDVGKYDVEKSLPIYLTSDEMRTELSKHNKKYYDEYITALKELDMFKGLGRESYAGQIEGQKPLENLLYGYRLSTAPVNLGVDKPGEGFRYAYNPSTGEYKKEVMKGGGKMMSYYQQGLDFQPKTISKKGSKIKKDNDGYWNPENWGKPVEIDSNEITMQGVYEPLLGVSDTGDTQMMFPGEDYTFEGESVTEYPVAQNGINQLDAQPNKKLDQLLNFTNFNDMANAKKGKKIPKAQIGINSSNLNFLSTGANAAKQFNTYNNISSGIQAGSKIGQAIQRVIQAVEQKKMAKQTRALATPVAQAAATRDVDAPNMLARQIQANRPEYNLVTANDVGVNPFGTGYDVLSMAQNGTMIGGNPTEIQNTYAPNTLYDDLGYEPLDESSRVKQFERGGGIPKAKLGLGTAFNLIGQGANVAGDIIAGIIGLGTKNMNQQSNELLGQAAFQSGMQGLLGGQYGGYMKHGGDVGDEYKWVSHNWQPQVIAKFGEHNVKDLLKPDPMMNTLRAGGHLKEYTPPSERAMSTERPQFAMGGELNTHWGGDMELASYNPYMPGSGETRVARGLYHSESDGRGNTGIGMSYGGNMVEVENGEPIIEMQEGGSVQDKSAVVFGNLKIPSYVASELGDKDAKGKMFKSYVNLLNKKEVIQNNTINTALKITDLVDGNSSFDLLSMNTAKAMLTGADMKLKEIAQKKMMAAGAQQAMHETADEQGFDVEQFINRGKIVQAKNGANTAQSGTSIVDYMRSQGEDSSFKRRAELAKEAGIQNYKGTSNQNMELLKYVQGKKAQQPATPYQPAYTPIKLEADLEKPKFMQPVDFDKPLYTPQGIPELGDVIQNRYDVTGVVPEELSFQSDYYSTPESEPFGGYDKTKRVGIPSSITDMVSRAVASAKSTEGEDKKKMKALDIAQMAYNELLPFIRPVNQMELDPSQLAGEMMALSTNVLEPVQAQFYQPMLEARAPKMTAQDALNRNQADFNALARQVGNNPAALSVLAAQKQAADRQAIAQTEAFNIQQEMATRNRNIASLNDASLKNLAIADTQYQRQAGAKSATKAQAQAALNSIASKIGQNKLENLQSAVMQNMYNYRFGPRGRMINYNPLAQFNIPQIANLTDEERKALKEQSEGRTTAKNGSIVKAIKNL